MYPYLGLYLIIYLFGGLYNLKKKRQAQGVALLLILCFALALTAGLRHSDWPDTKVYIDVFKTQLTPLMTSKSENQPTAYSEPLFIELSRLIKTFSSSSIIYLTTLSLLTMGILYKVLKNGCVYPIIGLCVYISRFYISRNLMQIRAALALVFVLYAIKYVYDRNFRSFIFVIIMATLCHFSAIIALPLYWMNRKLFKTKHIIIIIAACLIIIGVSSMYISQVIAQINAILGFNNTYVGGDENYSSGLGLLNPMIYYQILLLILLSAKYQSLSKNKYYYILLNGYLYSTTIFILFSPFLVLSGRLSTVLASLEVFIIPALISSNNSQRTKYISYTSWGIVLIAIFYMNLNKVQIYL